MVPVEKKIKKCIKSYLCGKKYINQDNKLALDYLKQSSKLLQDIRMNKEMGEFELLIDDTENECNSLITSTLLTTINQNTPIYSQSTNLDIFTIIDRGDYNELVKMKYNEYDFYKFNNEGLTPLHHAIKCGDTRVLKYAFTMGVDIDVPENNYGYTLLEFAGLSRDPNMCKFMELNGADIKKHIDFRNKKYKNKNTMIDVSLIIKILLTKYNPLQNNNLDFLFTHIKPTEMIGLDDIEFKVLIQHINSLLMENKYKDQIIKTLKEELAYDIQNSLGCPSNKLNILLYNLVPYIEYPHNLTLKWLLLLEMKYCILKKLKNTNIKEIKKELYSIFNNTYIKTHLLTKEHIINLFSQWIKKINV